LLIADPLLSLLLEATPSGEPQVGIAEHGETADGIPADPLRAGSALAEIIGCGCAHIMDTLWITDPVAHRRQRNAGHNGHIEVDPLAPVPPCQPERS
jgi:hypothetical protein